MSPRAGDGRRLARVLADLDRLCWWAARRWARPGAPGLEREDLYQEARRGVVEAWRLRRAWSAAERLRRAKFWAVRAVLDVAEKSRRPCRMGIVVPLSEAVAVVGEDGLAAVEAAFLLQEVWRASTPGEREALRRACGAAPAMPLAAGSLNVLRSRARARVTGVGGGGIS